MNAKILVGLFLCVFSTGVLAKKYNYVDYATLDSFEGGKVSLVLDVSSKRIMSSDWNNAVAVCDDTSKFYCFSYPAVAFYIPKSGIRLSQRWTSEGVLFVVLRRELLKIFGKSKQVWIIKAERSNRDDFFYYSEVDGLLAIKHVANNGKQVQFFMIADGRGFPW